MHCRIFLLVNEATLTAVTVPLCFCFIMVIHTFVRTSTIQSDVTASFAVHSGLYAVTSVSLHSLYHFIQVTMRVMVVLGVFTT